jgi:hypothetical protein
MAASGLPIVLLAVTPRGRPGRPARALLPIGTARWVAQQRCTGSRGGPAAHGKNAASCGPPSGANDAERVWLPIHNLPEVQWIEVKFDASGHPLKAHRTMILDVARPPTATSLP